MPCVTGTLVSDMNFIDFSVCIELGKVLALDGKTACIIYFFACTIIECISMRPFIRKFPSLCSRDFG